MIIYCVVILALCLVSVYAYKLYYGVAYKYEELQSKYFSTSLEKTKIEEKCFQLQQIEEKYAALQQEYRFLEKENVKLTSDLNQERKNMSEKIQLLAQAEEKLTDTFKSIGSDVLRKNNQSFIDLATSTFKNLQDNAKAEMNTATKNMSLLVDPIKTALNGVDTKLGELEKDRVGSSESLKQQINDLIQSQNHLKSETNNLVAALRTPNIRGMWGEMHLRRVVEFSGMLEHCDFEEQVTFTNDGVKLRPDLVVFIPGEGKIIIDAKAPLQSYLSAMDSHNEQSRNTHLKEHARLLKEHIKSLARKKYAEQFQQESEFVVMFLPGEVFLSSALEQDKSILEYAMQENVMLATPTNLLILLHTAAVLWRRERSTEDAKNILNLGKELYARISNLSEYFAKLGDNISRTVDMYNTTTSCLESRVLSTIRKFNDLETHKKQIINVKKIEKTVSKN